MEREQRKITIIDLEDHGPWRLRVGAAIVAVLVALLVIAPFVIDEVTAPAESPVAAPSAGESAPPEYCYPSFNIPHMLDPVASIVLPGWTRLCGLLTQPDMSEPFNSSD